MNIRFPAGLLAGALALQVHAAEHDIEEVVVTGPFHEPVTDSALPISVLSNEELRKQVANSLGDTLNGQLGVHSASFGTGVGQPVLRGQSGKRVQILQNSVFVADAANVSPDHANGIEPLLADTIEVVRGPATLLYGSGAIGGVVNVIDQRVPTRLLERPEIVLEQSHNSASDENRSILGVTASLGEFGIHFDAYDRRNEQVNIPGAASDEAAIEALEALAGEDHEEEEAEEAAIEGYIPNSDGEATGGSFGVSWVQAHGYIGLSYNRFESEYGLPPGVHGHHEEAHEDEEEEEHEGEEHGEEAIIRLALEQERYDFKGDYHFDSGLFDKLAYHVGYTDYEHVELEIEDGVTAIGTRFQNHGYDSRFTLTTRERNGWQGVWGVQLNDTDFSAIGEEAFIPATDIRNVALFAVERLEQSNQTFEFAARVEKAELESGACDQDDTVFSLSASLVRNLGAAGSVTLGLGRSERAATIEERFSNVDTSTCRTTTELVTHAATNLIEVGNADLDTETAINFDVGYRFSVGSAVGEITAFYNDIDDYVYLNLTGQEVDETQVANFEAQAAEFYGFEALLEFPLTQFSDSGLNGFIMTDLVRGEFSDGSHVPRIPPARLGFGVNWTSAHWTTEMEITRVFQQDRAANLELATAGYTMVNLYADYHWYMSNEAELTLFARIDNLLDQEVRNHVSFLKNVAPESGRGIRAGVRLQF